MNNSINYNEIKSVLIIGIAGGLARITASSLAKRYPHLKITGVDNRPIKNKSENENIEPKSMRYTRGNFEKLYRENTFDIVFHLGRMSHTSSVNNLAKRLDLNLMGSKRILELSQQHGVKKIIILSTFHVYGALHDNPVFIKEDSPLKASIKHPELRDVTEMDQICSSFMWKNQNELSTVILRPCNIIGPKIRNSLTQYLTTNYAPVGIDFNPMFQFIHEFDMANIIINSVQKMNTGVYNIAPDNVISLREAKEIIGKKTLKVPIIALEAAAKIINRVWTFPDYLVDYIKFACIIDNTQMKESLGKDPFKFTIKESLELIKID